MCGNQLTFYFYLPNEEKKETHKLFTISVYAASDNITDFSIDGKLLVVDTNARHEYHFLRIASHLCKDSQVPQKTRING